MKSAEHIASLIDLPVRDDAATEVLSTSDAVTLCSIAARTEHFIDEADELHPSPTPPSTDTESDSARGSH